MPTAPADLLAFLEHHARRPLSAREILTQLGMPKKAQPQLVRRLDKLVRDGVLICHKNGRYSLPRQVNLVVGRLSMHRDGYGFVMPPPGEGNDVFVPARFLHEAMDGDQVVVRVEGRGRGGKPEGRVIRVQERAHQTVVGRYEEGRSFGYVVPADPKLTHDVYIPWDASSQARPGQVVVARIDSYPDKTRNPEGTVVEVLGDPDDPEVEILTIVHKYGLPHRFSAEVETEAAAVADRVAPAELEGREDLRSLPFVTIDGETAKDFDDAVSVRREEGGRIRLWVAIADVGHYVTEGSAIDREAYERGTSVYFPGRCIPMLPEALSNGICSLNPDVERLAFVAEMIFDGEGRRLDSRFYPAVIRSCARLTYTGVHRMLEGEGAVAEEQDILPELRTMAELAGRLTAMRRSRGSLDFDLPEAEIVLDLQGRPENIVRTERTVAHRLIEEFMLAANEAVAAFLAAHDTPFLYRVHEPPDPERLLAFQEFIAHFNYGLELGPAGVAPHRLQTLLAELEGKPEERMINQILLRSMKQARYAPENVGHFGLAADLYCHFTSPIRRYPDLQVHRVLRRVVAKGKLAEGYRRQLGERLPAMGEHTSQTERRAMEAEREIVDLKKCQFMVDKVGEEFDGIVSGVQPFGFFVELSEIFVEGLVHVSALTDDFYQYEEDWHRLLGMNRRRIFQIGTQVRVKVQNVNLARREIDFVLAEMDENSGIRPVKRRAKVRKPASKP
jgi:ribonuclease R